MFHNLFVAWSIYSLAVLGFFLFGLATVGKPWNDKLFPVAIGLLGVQVIFGVAVVASVLL